MDPQGRGSTTRIGPWCVRRFPPFVVRWTRNATSVAYGLFWLAVVEVGLRVVSLPSLARRLGVRLSLAETDTPHVHDSCVLSPTETKRLRVLWRLTRRWPFGQGPCLRQAMVEGRIVRRMKPVLRIGVENSSRTARESLLAHAWIELAGKPLWPQSDQFLPLVKSSLQS